MNSTQNKSASLQHPRMAYRIETLRLVIRCWQPEDGALAKAAIDDNLDHLRPWMPWALDEPTSLEEKVNLMRRFRARFDLDQDYTFGILAADEQRVLGGCGLHTRLGPNAYEIGYWIHKDYVNQGLATEAAAALTRVAFEVGKVGRIEIHVSVGNHASAAVPPKLGYRLEGTLGRRIVGSDGELHDMMVWTLFSDEYPSSPAAKAEIRAYDVNGKRLL
ncbi:MAG: GNAT family protein [Anaerolineales bacterium]|jgi:RimJ/RimL family protein N-acetyltransferase